MPKTNSSVVDFSSAEQIEDLFDLDTIEKNKTENKVEEVKVCFIDSISYALMFLLGNPLYNLCAH